MRIRSIILVVMIAGLTGVDVLLSQQTQRHPCLISSPQEILHLRAEKVQYPFFAETFRNARTIIDSALRRPINVPIPKDAAGVTHDRHKENAVQMQRAGMMFQLTAQEKYAVFVRDMLKKYAKLYPTLGVHPAALNKSGGRLFWQTLNETVWLVNASIAYDLVYEAIDPSDRLEIERGVLRPMAEFFITECASTIDRIHNHGTWMTASVGMLGFVLGDERYVSIALNGTKQDGTTGYLRQLEMLFSPDGYYSEGPYYARYAIYPFVVFAESIERNRPALHMYQRKNGVLGKAVMAILQLTTDDGEIIFINDAVRKSMKVKELVFAVDYTLMRYPENTQLLSVAAAQGRVSFDPTGFAAAKALASATPAPLVLRSAELSDGPLGNEGGIGVLRTNAPSSMLVMKYTAQGGGHGHFDRLNLMLFDEGNPVLTDYGAARFVNVEPKFGGRYLKENTTWAKQTVAHNTLVVDAESHYKGNLELAEKNPGRRRFFSTEDPSCQVMSASAPNVVPGVSLERTVALVSDPRCSRPVVIDVLRVEADREHQYTLPFHYTGQIMSTTVAYRAEDTLQRTLGTKSGYQHIWKTAGGTSDSSILMTWLSNGRYYSLLSAAEPRTEIAFGRTGASDPDFNLRSEPVLLLSREARSTVFVSMLQRHGVYEFEEELSVGYLPPFNRTSVLASSPEATVVEFSGENGLKWQFAVAHGTADEKAEHTIQVNGKPYTWRGNYSLVKQ